MIATAMMRTDRVVTRKQDGTLACYEQRLEWDEKYQSWLDASCYPAFGAVNMTEHFQVEELQSWAEQGVKPEDREYADGFGFEADGETVVNLQINIFGERKDE